MSLIYPNLDSICPVCRKPFDSWTDMSCPCQAAETAAKHAAENKAVEAKRQTEEFERQRSVDLLNSLLKARE